MYVCCVGKYSCFFSKSYLTSVLEEKCLLPVFELCLNTYAVQPLLYSTIYILWISGKYLYSLVSHGVSRLFLLRIFK